MTRFSKLQLVDGKLVETDIREIPQSAMLQCPHAIMVGDHYRDDGSCRCNDVTHHDMAEWGYQWNGNAWVDGEHND